MPTAVNNCQTQSIKSNPKNKIAILGAYPPGYGGISIHVERLTKLLDKQDIPYIVYAFNKPPESDKVRVVKNRLLFTLSYIINPKASVTHIHIGNIWVLGLYSLLSLRPTKTILTLHNVRNIQSYFNSKSKIMPNIAKYILHKYSHIICVSPEIEDILVGNGFDKDMLSTIPAFIPPIVIPEDVENVMNKDAVGDFITNHYPLISTNASRLALYNNHDLYGIDMAIELLNSLKEKYEHTGLIISLSEINDKDHYQKILNKIKDYNLEQNIMLLEKTIFYPILLKSDLFIRPTNTDGDAISVREALSFGIPVVTSDAVPRPNGCYIFKTRDQNDLYSVAVSVLQKTKSRPESQEKVQDQKLCEIIALINLYQNLLQDDG